jgi:opacity protein-like surface antigen
MKIPPIHNGTSNKEKQEKKSENIAPATYQQESAVKTTKEVTPISQKVEVIKEEKIAEPTKQEAVKPQPVKEEPVAEKNKKEEAKITNNKKSNDSSIRFYAGADGLWSQVTNTIYTQYPLEAPATQANIHTSGQNNGFGLNLGAILRDKRTNFFTGLEIFYDKINTKTRSPWFKTEGLGYYSDWSDCTPSSANCMANDTININNRFGAKLNLGYRLFDKLDIFATGGVANIRYEVLGYGFRNYYFSSSLNSPNVGNAHIFSARTTAPIFGGGFSYSINNNWSLRTIYERQSAMLKKITNYNSGSDANNTGYAKQGYKSTIDTVKVGASYVF